MTAPSSQYLGGLYGIDENFLVGGPQNFDAVSKLSKITFNNFWQGNTGRDLIVLFSSTFVARRVDSLSYL